MSPNLIRYHFHLNFKFPSIFPSLYFHVAPNESSRWRQIKRHSLFSSLTQSIALFHFLALCFLSSSTLSSSSSSFALFLSLLFWFHGEKNNGFLSQHLVDYLQCSFPLFHHFLFQLPSFSRRPTVSSSTTPPGTSFLSPNMYAFFLFHVISL